MKCNLIYFGSPDFSAQILESILKNDSVNVVGVVSTPDKPTGRKLVLTPSPVSLLASSYDLPVYKPIKLDEANLAHLKLLKPDILLIASYGKIIPQSYLDLPKLGTYNIHFSLLPKYRGALCISEAIKNRDKVTGVTLMEMDDKLDHGSLISQTTLPIDTTDNTSTLTTKLTRSAIALLANKLPEICAHKYTKVPQDESQATFTPSFKTHNHQTAYIPFEKIALAQDGVDSDNVCALINSLNTSPGAWTMINSLDVKIISVFITDNKLVINTVQLAGKSPVTWKQFISGHKIS